MSSKIDTPFYAENDYPDMPSTWDIAAWLKDDEGVMIYDRNDIWKMDLEGQKPPINLTNHYGAKNGIQFRFVSFGDFPTVIDSHDTLLLSAFEIKSKENGFYRLIPEKRVLEKLIQSPHMYLRPEVVVTLVARVNQDLY